MADIQVPIASWSHLLPTRTRLVPYNRAMTAALDQLAGPVIFRGAGRSFGDCAYVSNGTTITSGELHGILDFDRSAGVIECASGTSLLALHLAVSGSGWAVPVYGGTRWATVGGAIGNDIHGKNHARRGSFGNHVLGLTLLTVDGSLVTASPDSHPDLFAATVGGIGLTGLITSARLRLVPAVSDTVRVRAVPFTRTAGLGRLLEQTDCGYQFGWLRHPCQQACGLHYRAEHVAVDRPRDRDPRRRGALRVNLATPVVLGSLDRLRHLAHRRLDRTMHVIDLNYWGDRFEFRSNLFGRRGFHEYQFTVAAEVFDEAVRTLGGMLAGAGLHSYFTVAKRLGGQRPPGLLSFPREGCTLSTQIPDGPGVLGVLRSFTEIVIDLGGRVYLAKDSCVTKNQLERMYPEIDRWRGIVERYDPKGLIQSDLARRLDLKPW
ncbi:FAD-binding protein [Kitasatospora sp. NPDC056138]|uniref:FAD-binding oxidoreductase n=1 Tax=Kitasatospora sp. NPDC056138 TaxID=3345724 RepID=UPI0035DD2B41